MLIILLVAILIIYLVKLNIDTAIKLNEINESISAISDILSKMHLELLASDLRSDHHSVLMTEIKSSINRLDKKK